MKSGFVGLIGRPNVGKSTLLNAMLERKIAITSHVSGTTRNIIQGIYNDDDSQIVFVDLPGIHKPKNRLGTYMNKKAYTMMEDVDVILFMLDVTEKFGKGDKFILDKIKEIKKPTFLILNKVDLIDRTKLFKIITEYKDLYNFNEIFPISALKSDNTTDLINTIKDYLTDEVKYFPEEDVTNVSRNFMISEIVREKILRLTKEEIPHTVTCVVEEYEELEDIINISVLIIIDRDNIKKIIIGKQGAMLKKIGTYARGDIEEFLGKKVFLSTYVKTIEDWRDKEKYLKELGLNELE